MKWPLESRHIFGLGGHLMNLPALFRQAAAAIDGLAAPPIRLSAVKASTSFFMSSPFGLGSASHRTFAANGRCQEDYKA